MSFFKKRRKKEPLSFKAFECFLDENVFDRLPEEIMNICSDGKAVRAGDFEILLFSSDREEDYIKAVARRRKGSVNYIISNTISSLDDLARELHSRERRENKCFDDAKKIKLRFDNESYGARIFILTRRKSQYPEGL